ncbi:MAG: Fic family protein [Bacteroidia bacterium]
MSYDTITKPPYEINTEIIRLVASISEKIGRVNESLILPSSPKLRKQNQIKSIHASLQIEGNTLSERQVTAILENKAVFGPEKDIREVQNAINAYENIGQFNAHSNVSFLKAHQMLLEGLVLDAGKYRTEGVGIIKGEMVQHVAPPYEEVPYLMKNLFTYLKTSSDLALIKSCVFHYETELIHPFMDSNGRIGRLWQSVILAKEYPIFKYIPFENLVAQNHEAYYQVLSICDKLGNSTRFIEYMLGLLDDALKNILKAHPTALSQNDRLQHFVTLNILEFTRKGYRNVFKNISTATASRDLRRGLEKGMFTSSGDKRLTIYKLETRKLDD